MSHGTTLAIVVALFCAGGCAPSSHLLPPPAQGDGLRQLADCPGAPHCVISRRDGGGDYVAPLVAGTNAEDAHARLLAVLEQQPRCTVLEDDGRYVHAEFVTTLARFRDDVEFLIRDDGRIDVRSSSRIGWYDWETNRKRIERLRSALAALGA